MILELHRQGLAVSGIARQLGIDRKTVRRYTSPASRRLSTLVWRALPGQNKKQREGLALLTATMLDVRSANLMDVAASLPRDAERLDMRYQWISRLLGNELINTDEVMAPFASELLQRVCADGRQIILIIDQMGCGPRSFSLI